MLVLLSVLDQFEIRYTHTYAGGAGLMEGSDEKWLAHWGDHRSRKVVELMCWE